MVMPGMPSVPGFNAPQIDKAVLDALINRMRTAEMLSQPGTMGSLMGGGMSMAGGGMSAPGAAAAGGGMLASAMPWIGLAGGVMEGIGGAIGAKKDRKLQKDQLKEQKRSNTIQQGSSNAQLLQNLIRIMGGGGLYGR